MPEEEELKEVKLRDIIHCIVRNICQDCSCLEECLEEARKRIKSGEKIDYKRS